MSGRPQADSEPLTHFWHCWRFADHHDCAIELIERQSRENDDLLIRLDRAERALRDATRDPPKRDLTGTTAGQFGLGPVRAPFRRDAQPVRPKVPFGFGTEVTG